MSRETQPQEARDSAIAAETVMSDPAAVPPGDIVPCQTSHDGGHEGADEVARGHVIRIRASDDELSRIDANAKAAGLSRSAYMRRCALNEKVARASRAGVREQAPAWIDAAKQLAEAINAQTKAVNAIGRNVNQAVKRLNTGGLWANKTARQLVDDVAAIRNHVASTEKTATLLLFSVGGKTNAHTR